MTSQVEIYNLALMNIGHTQTVSSLEERSKERIVCSQFWTITRDAVLAEFNWPFATKYETLALIDDETKPWQYTYQYPTECLKALYLVNDGLIQPDERYQPEYETAYGDSGRVILTDHPDAVLAYITRVEDAGRFPPLFVIALAWRLAQHIAMPMTATQSLVQSCAQQYKITSQEAWAEALNESKYRNNHESEYVTVRGA